ncbi:16S rRNA (uracil(1498)-N(3))-methyltransferase [Agromyces sp. NBRC 114283]|uniref:16S rRNA (uracil(1498)-N(3))-methyltransferase n=1 Tax=Agromyces sp. NBRC 114283 TaxID=2994521 RepID=UPI0024A1C08C|nr:16S rRNA (uracil(1498)-N(3))-methyltransferase [Agromyces sp. NBRC 114283]GLU90200.1 ribosomal RNA small subunit methyltransferase E [Agromyces sp. NBRC 114283]
MASLYLDEGAELAAVAAGDVVRLGGPEARHAVQVARVRLGERISIGDGRGTVVTGPVLESGQGELTMEVAELAREQPATPALVLVQALAKGDRDELAVQAATELGVDRIVPWAAARSVSRWEGAKAEKGRQRWATIAREASKQSIRAWVPEVEAATPTARLPELLAGTRLLVLEPTAERGLAQLELDERPLALLVGPEGGVAPEELARLTAAGAEPVRLGPTVLRTSTAGPAAIALLSARLGRW